MPTAADGHDESRALSWALWAFVALGVALRVARYARDFPLWWDEAFLAINFVRRDYLDLLRPLDYGQICPILFLWVERAMVQVGGFSAWTLRLAPLACSLAGLLMFPWVLGRVTRGVPRLIAVAFLAVAFHPIRHAADLKPYASDLLAALALIGPALAWWQSRRLRWLGALAAIVPIAIGLSHPAIFVAAGVGAGLAPAVWREGDRRSRAALAAFGLAAAGAFLACYLACTGGQSSARLVEFQAIWSRAFPPLGSAWGLARWLVITHSGVLLAYPFGGPGGASAASLVLAILGARALARTRRVTPLAVCLGPFVAALAASALRRYPYGGAARFYQFVAPSVCLLAGLGAAEVLALVPRIEGRRRALGAVLVGLAIAGVAAQAVELRGPGRAIHAQKAREFARRFWPEVARGAEVVCARTDLGIGPWDSVDLNVAVYVCNQRIYSPARRRGGPRLDAVSAAHPLRCVLDHSNAVPGPEDARKLAAFLRGYDTRRREEIVVNMAGPGAPPRPERYVVLELVPSSGERVAARR